MRYRKHTCRLVENTVKTIVWNKRLYTTKEEIDGLRMEFRFSQLSIIGSNNNKSTLLSKSTNSNNNNKSLINSNNIRSDDKKLLLTLRKLIDMRFSNRSILNNNSNNMDRGKQQLIRFKLNIIMKLT